MKRLLSTTALILSLSLSGMAYAYNGADGKEGHHGFMQGALSKLPQDKAEAFRNTLKQAREKNTATHEQMKKLHDQLYTIMAAPTFDKKAYLAKNAEIQGLKEKMQKTRSAAFAMALGNLTQEERTSVADSFRDMQQKHPWGGKKEGKSDNDEKPVGDAQ